MNEKQRKGFQKDERQIATRYKHKYGLNIKTKILSFVN